MPSIKPNLVLSIVGQLHQLGLDGDKPSLNMQPSAKGNELKWLRWLHDVTLTLMKNQDQS